MSENNIILFSENDNFEKIVLESEIPVIVDFYADWCTPCKKIGPELAKAWEDNKTFKLVKICVDNFQELSEKYKVSSIPHVILFCCGKQEMSFIGYDKAALEKMVEKCKEKCRNLVIKF